MKIRELVQKTGVPKETIHYYIREGLLRRPRKAGVNSAEYGEKYIDQIKMIKDLRDNYFLPLPVIKKIFAKVRKQPVSDQTILLLRNKYFRPLDRLLSKEIRGTEVFLQETGLSAKWLEKMEQWEIITPRVENGDKIYSGDNVIIGKLLVDMDRYGMGPRDGHDPKSLYPLTNQFKSMFSMAREEFLKHHLGRLSPEAFSRKSVIATEIMGIYSYLLYRKLTNDANRQLADRTRE